MVKRCCVILTLGVISMAGAVRAAEGEDARAIADQYVAAMEGKGYSFLTKEELARRREVVTGWVEKWLKRPLTGEGRAAVMAGVGRCVERLYPETAGKVAYGNGFGSGGEEWAYLNDRDRFLTFGYHLWAGLQAMTGELTPEEGKRQEAQRAWMRGYLQGLKDRGEQEPRPSEGVQAKDVRAWALAKLEEDFGDPLSTLYGALPEAGFVKLQKRFKAFTNGLASDLHDMEVAGLTSRFPEHDDAAGRYGRVYVGKLPFEDTVVDLWGNGPTLHFESNAVFRGSMGNVSVGSLYDVVRCVEVAGTGKDVAGVEALAAKEGRGELTLDGTELVAVRGAKVAVLPVKTWFEADKLTVEELRGVVKEGGKERLSVKGLPSMNGAHRLNRSEGEFFAVVETKEGRVAVVYLSSLEFGLGLWCRARE